MWPFSKMRRYRYHHHRNNNNNNNNNNNVHGGLGVFPVPWSSK
jgi:hypothetical protein